MKRWENGKLVPVADSAITRGSVRDTTHADRPATKTPRVRKDWFARHDERIGRFGECASRLKITDGGREKMTPDPEPVAVPEPRRGVPAWRRKGMV